MCSVCPLLLSRLDLSVRNSLSHEKPSRMRRPQVNDMYFGCQRNCGNDQSLGIGSVCNSRVMEVFLTRNCVLSWPHIFVQQPLQGGGNPDSRCLAAACHFLSECAEHSEPWSSQSAVSAEWAAAIRTPLQKRVGGLRPLITGPGSDRGPALAESLCQHLFSPVNWVSC